MPAILPGQRFNAAVVAYLRAGLAAGMTLPDAADPSLETFRVVRERPAADGTGGRPRPAANRSPGAGW